MILRRVVRHLKQQHWTGVFIELVIVVLGVFIGLQVSDWNEGRKDAARGKEYLLRLHDELLQDAEQKIARPRQVYLGHDKRSYIPLDHRA